MAYLVLVSMTVNVPVHRRPMTTSSPHSSLIGPDRLTLPPGQQPPNLSYNRANDMAPQAVNNVPQRQQRPASRNFAQCVYFDYRGWL